MSFVDLMLVLIGVAAVVFGEPRLNRMSRRTALRLRVSIFSVALSGAGLILSVFWSRDMILPALITLFLASFGYWLANRRDDPYHSFPPGGDRRRA